MNEAGWLCLGIMALAVLGYLFHVAYARGYAAGRYKERRAIARVLNEERRRGLQAQRHIDYLYERACWQVATSAQSDGNDRS